MSTALRLMPPDRGLGWRPYAWLVYLSAYIAFPFVVPTSPAQWALHLLGVAAFVPLYFAGYWLEGARRIRIILGLMALGLALTWLNPAAAVFFVYAASFVGGSRTGGEAALWIAGITLGQSLSVIALKADLAAKLIDRDPARAAGEVSEMARVSRQALAEVRQAVQRFRTATFADELSRAVSVLMTAGIEVKADPAAAGRLAADALSPEAEHALALALREAATNVVRHARARHCTLALAEEGASLHLVVQDDGVGGDLTAGNGLTGMKRRVEQAGGTLTWSGARGMRVDVVVPDRRTRGAARA